MGDRSILSTGKAVAFTNENLEDLSVIQHNPGM